MTEAIQMAALRLDILPPSPPRLSLSLNFLYIIYLTYYLSIHHLSYVYYLFIPHLSISLSSSYLSIIYHPSFTYQPSIIYLPIYLSIDHLFLIFC